jgi:hypothetical protein
MTNLLRGVAWSLTALLCGVVGAALLLAATVLGLAIEATWGTIILVGTMLGWGVRAAWRCAAGTRGA